MKPITAICAICLLAMQTLCADVYYNNRTFTASETTSEPVYIGHASSTDGGAADNALVTIKNGATWDIGDIVRMGNVEGLSRLVIEEGAELLNVPANKGSFQLGMVESNSSIITNRGLLKVYSLRLGRDENVTRGYNARVDNFGTLILKNGLSIGAAKLRSGYDGAVLYNHSTGVITNERTGTYGFYLGDRGPGCITNEGSIVSVEQGVLRFGSQSAEGTGKLVMMNNGRYEAGKEVYFGFKTGSRGILEMFGNSRFDGAKNSTLCVMGAGSVSGTANFNEPAYGEILMTDNSKFSVKKLILGKGPRSTVSVEVSGFAEFTANEIVFGEGAGIKATMTLRDNATLIFDSDDLKIANSVNSTGRVEVVDYNNNSFAKNLYIGSGEGSLGVFKIGGTTSMIYEKIKGCYLGCASGATGCIELGGNAVLTVTNNLTITNYTENANAQFIASGDSKIVVSNDVHAGMTKFTRGEVLLSGNSFMDVKGSLFIGSTCKDDDINMSSITGRVVLADNACVVCTNIWLGYSPKYNGNGQRRSSLDGRLEVANNAVISNVVMNLGGAMYKNSVGCLKMNGGSVIFNPAIRRNALEIGTSGDCPYGVIKGWGKLAYMYLNEFFVNVSEIGKSATSTFLGQVIADGGILDCGRIGVYGYGGGTPNTCNVNGWYAINKGLLRFPRSLARKAKSYNTVGDYPVNACRFVNTFQYTFDTDTMNNTGTYVFSELYATDRDDIPAGLPTGKGIHHSAVWRIGHFNASATPDVDDEDLTADHKQNFTSLKLKFHYDPALAEIEDVRHVKVYRCTDSVNGGWTCVASITAPDSASPYIETVEMAPSSELWNGGWFAIVGTPRVGTVMVVR